MSRNFILFSLTITLTFMFSIDISKEMEHIEVFEVIELETEYTTGAETMFSETTTQQKLSPELSHEEIKLVALVTMAEAEGECEEGKRLVIDTILNRIDSAHFPDTVEGVVYQPNQFEAMQNGRVDRSYINDEVQQLVVDELNSRTNHNVIFFNANDYSKYGDPMFQVGNHYFSSLN